MLGEQEKMLGSTGLSSYLSCCTKGDCSLWNIIHTFDSIWENNSNTVVSLVGCGKFKAVNMLKSCWRAGLRTCLKIHNDQYMKSCVIIGLI